MFRLALVAACALLVCAGCAETRLLLVTQYADGDPRVEALSEGICGVFSAEATPYSLTVFNMGTLAHPTEIWRDEMGRAAVVQVRALEPDVVFAAGDDAARYFAQRLAGTATRIVFLDLKGNPADYFSPSPRAAGPVAEPGPQGQAKPKVARNVTGVREDVPVREAFSLIKKLVPQARGVAVLADNSLEADAVIRRIEAEEGLPVRVVSVRRAGTLEEWKAAILDLQDKADALCIAGYRSVLAEPGGREAVAPAELLRITAQENRLPDFTFWEEAVGPEGVLAAVAVPAAAQARQAAGMAARLLYYGEDIADIPIATCAQRKTLVNAQRAGELGLKLRQGLKEVQAE